MKKIDSLTSGDPSGDGNSACFLPLQSGAASQRRQNDGCSQFQPLYRGSPGGQGGLQDAAAKDTALLFEETHQKAFQKGLKEGNEEGARIAKASLAPIIQAFNEIVQTLNAFQQQLEVQVCTDVPALALAISEHIIGRKQSVSTADMDGLKGALKEAVTENCRMILCMHPTDLEQLTALVKTEGRDFPAHPVLSLKADPDLSPGVLNADVQSGSHAQIVKQALALLSEALQN